MGAKSLRRFFKLKFARTQSRSRTSRLAGPPTLTLLARPPYSLARLYSGSPTSLARLPTLASLLWPALRFRSRLPTLHVRLRLLSRSPPIPGAQSYDPNPNKSVLSCGETPAARSGFKNHRRRCGLQRRSCRSRPPPQAALPHSLCSARAHPPISRAAGLGCAIAPLCLLLSSPASQPHSCRRYVDGPASLRLCQRRRWS